MSARNLREGATSTVAGHLSDRARAITSLALFLHIFVVLAAVASRNCSSQLAQRMGGLPGVRSYAGLLAMDTNYQFHLTYARPDDFDHFVEVRLNSGSQGTDAGTIALDTEFPVPGLWPAMRFRHYERLAGRLAAFGADPESDFGAGILAQAIAAHASASSGAQSGKIRAFELNVESLTEDTQYEPRKFRAPRLARGTTFRDRYYQVAYEADFVISEDSIDIMKVEPEAEVAPPPPADNSAKEPTDS